MSTSEIAAILKKTEKTVRETLKSLTKGVKRDLPKFAARRYSDDEVEARLAHMRDQCIVLAQDAVERLSLNMRAGRPVKDISIALAGLLNSAQSLSTRAQLLSLIKGGLPATQEARESAYVRLLWTLSASGTIPAVKLLARAWGVIDAAESADLHFSFGDYDPANQAH